MLSCGGDEPVGPAPDTTPPRVLEVGPAPDATDISVDAYIWIKFSEPVVLDHNRWNYARTRDPVHPHRQRRFGDSDAP